MLWVKLFCLLFLVQLVVGNVQARKTGVFFKRAAKGRRLRKCLIKETRASTDMECAHLCLFEGCHCKSVNYRSTTNKCQLNNDTAAASENGLNLVEHKEFDYLERIDEKSLHDSYPAGHKGFSVQFHTLGASGRLGPTSLGSFYAGQSHQSMVTVTNGTQYWTVPYTGTYRIKAVGAAGGYDSYGPTARGRGVYMSGDFSLTKGTVIKILVGQKGAVNQGSTSSGGGGGTFVVTSSNTPLLISGGGGGIAALGTRLKNSDASTGTAGKPNQGISAPSWSGGANGSGASEQDGSYVDVGGGGGGFYTSGRSSKSSDVSKRYGGEGGKGFLQGGAGGRSWFNNNGFGGFGGGGGAYGGPGGGGGYSGGALGYDTNSCAGGGGSYNSGKNQQNIEGYNENGHGFVDIVLKS